MPNPNLSNKSTQTPPPRCGDYDSIHVLATHWAESDNPGYREETEAFAHFFSTRLGYPTTVYAIPSHESEVQLGRQMDNLIATPAPACGEKKLVVIYYGGCADPDDDEETGNMRRAIWQA